MFSNVVEAAEVVQWIAGAVRQSLVFRYGAVKADSSRRLREFAAKRSLVDWLRWLQAAFEKDRVAENRIAAFLWMQLRHRGKEWLPAASARDINDHLVLVGALTGDVQSKFASVDALFQEIDGIVSMPEADACFAEVFRDSVSMALLEEAH